MKKVYCANCGTCLNITRRALPKYARIIDVAEYHECLDTPTNLDLDPIPESYPPRIEGKDKFVKKLNELPKPSPYGVDTMSVGDQRKSQDLRSELRSTAPKSLTRQLRDLPNSTPVRGPEDEE